MHHLASFIQDVAVRCASCVLRAGGGVGGGDGGIEKGLGNGVKRTG